MARAKKATGAAGAAITLEHVASNQGSSADDGLNAVDAEGSDDSGADNSGGGVGHAADGNAKRAGGKGRRKIQIEYVKDKAKRTITFSKRKAGIFSKARELSTLTGASLILLIASESGTVYSFTTEKFQPLVAQAPGKALIAACLNGTVAMESFSKPVAHPKGGEIMIRDAFSKEEEPPKASTSMPLMSFPPMPDPLPELQQPLSAQDFIYSHYDLDPNILPGASTSASTHSAPLSKSPFLGSEQNSPPTPAINPASQPHGSKRKAPDPPLPPLPPEALARPADIAVDDVTEEECARRMSRLRRSLSIERRFEESDDAGRPLSSRPPGEEQGRHRPISLAEQAASLSGAGPLPSLTETAEAWSRVRDRFFNGGLKTG